MFTTKYGTANTSQKNVIRGVECTRSVSRIFGQSLGTFPEKLQIDGRAWEKFQFYLETGYEVSGFGISSPTNLLHVTDIALIKQEVTATSISLDPVALSDFIYDQYELYGRDAPLCGRIWTHTHPGMCPTPSCVDEQNFDEQLSRHDWSIMLIISRDCAYARIRLFAAVDAPPPLTRIGGSFIIPVQIHPYVMTPEDKQLWTDEYNSLVTVITYVYPTSGFKPAVQPYRAYDELDWYDYLPYNNTGKTLPPTTPGIEQNVIVREIGKTISDIGMKPSQSITNRDVGERQSACLTCTRWKRKPFACLDCAEMDEFAACSDETYDIETGEVLDVYDPIDDEALVRHFREMYHIDEHTMTDEEVYNYFVVETFVDTETALSSDECRAVDILRQKYAILKEHMTDQEVLDYYFDMRRSKRYGIN